MPARSTQSDAGGATRANVLSLTGAAGSTINFGSAQHLNGFMLTANAIAAASSGMDKLIVVNSLAMSGAKFDLADNSMVIKNSVTGDLTRWSPPATPAAPGTATGINSSVAASSGNMLGNAALAAHSAARPSAPSLPCATLPGDANIDGTTDSADKAIVEAHILTLGGATWSIGDVNYDGNVDYNDWNIVTATRAAASATCTCAMGNCRRPCFPIQFDGRRSGRGRDLHHHNVGSGGLDNSGTLTLTASGKITVNGAGAISNRASSMSKATATSSMTAARRLAGQLRHPAQKRRHRRLAHPSTIAFTNPAARSTCKPAPSASTTA